jgi:DNA repair exonuclease SbcCD ATPase subunit
MRLIKCHIENFGKISDFDYDFKDGLNELCHENGWGKSTFAAFIKVMFYGFDNEGKRDELENERKRYRPWQGGAYGGNIAFDAGGKRYLAERTFGSKTSEDTFVLRRLETNMECDDYSSDLGEELFNIDAKSFLRTIYISQNDCEAVVTDSIHAKMGNLVDDTDDINNYDTVISGFQKTLNEMSPSRKTGSLYRLKEEIAEKKNSLRSRQDIETSLEKTEELKAGSRSEYNELSEKLQLISARQTKLSKYQDIDVKKKEYDKLCSEYEKRYEKFLEESEFFADGEPGAHELDECMEKNIALAAAVKSVENHTLTEDEAGAYVEYERIFADGVPDETKLNETLNYIQTLRQLEDRQRGITPGSDEREAYDRGRREFEKGIPSEEKISGLIREWDVYQEKKSGINTKKSNLELLKRMGEENRENIRKRDKTVNAALAALILVFAAAAAALEAISLKTGISPVYGITAGIVCVAAILVYIFRKRAHKGAGNNDSAEKRLPLQDEIEDDERIMDEIRDSMEDFFEEYDIPFNEYRVAESLYDLKSRSANFTKLAARFNDYEKLDKSGEIDEISKKTESFLNRYGFGGQSCERDGYETQIHRLQSNIKEYLRLKNKKESRAEAAVQAERFEREIYGYLSEHGFYIADEAEDAELTDRTQQINDVINEVRRHLEDYLHCKEEYGRIGLEKAAFERDNDVDAIMRLERPEGDETLEELNTQAAEIQRRMEQLHKNILDYDRQLDEYSERLQELDEQAQELSADMEKYESGKKEYELITRTKELMEKAKVSFTAKYVAPVKTGFDKYYALINGTGADKYYIDADSNVTVCEAGVQRDNRFLSRGLKDLTGICMRMALIEAMYKDETPFVIFDDPFVNFDMERLEGAMRLLKNIGNDYQVIYFTCHPDRKV